MAKQRIRRTNARIFLDTLDSLGGRNVRINNQTLRIELGWEPDKYNPIKDKLVNDGAIEAVTGGPGGAVLLTNAHFEIEEHTDEDDHEDQPIKLFISYSHADAEKMEGLTRHLTPLHHEYLMEIWTDGEISAGDEWAAKINEQIEEADIILLLISVDFINSSYCTSVEMTRALERHADNNVKLIPILVRDCYWQSMPFSHIQGLPTGMIAIANWEDEDRAYLDVVTNIRDILESLTE